MASTTPDYTTRQCAQDLIRHLDQHKGNMAEAEELAIPYMQRLMARPDLLDLGIKRDANHTADAVTLYYDHELTIVLGKMPKGTSIPVHNHGTWEVVAPYRGEIKYTMYKRNDDMTKPGYADLTVVDDRVMKKGDVSVCPPPPHDVHGFTALSDDLLLFAIVGGNFATIRQYYKPDEKAYIERHQQAWRLGGQKDE